SLSALSPTTYTGKPVCHLGLKLSIRLARHPHMQFHLLGAEDSSLSCQFFPLLCEDRGKCFYRNISALFDLVDLTAKAFELHWVRRAGQHPQLVFFSYIMLLSPELNSRSPSLRVRKPGEDESPVPFSAT